jgi:hypothetical protein
MTHDDHRDGSSRGAPAGREPSTASPPPRRLVLAIAGLDPSGGAGLAAALRVIRQLGFHPAPVCSALTA